VPACQTKPLAGVRVLELSTGIAGPIAGRFLAYFGAEVILVEPARGNRTPARGYGSNWLDLDDPALDAVRGDTSPALNEWHAGKLSIVLDLKTDPGQAAVRRLVPACDVLLTNFSRRAVAALQLDYPSVRTLRDDIVYVAMHGFGAEPGLPYADYVSYGPNQAALSGADELTGHPGGPPVISTSTYADFCSGYTGALAALAALEDRDRTGRGQLADMSQFAAVVSMLGPLLLDFEQNGHLARRAGNHAPRAAPRGVYRCRGQDAWVGIEVRTDAEFRSLAAVAHRPDWTADPRFSAARERARNPDELDEQIASWTSQHTPEEVAAWLQERGVPASALMDVADVLRDGHVASRGRWAFPPHARFGPDMTTQEAVHLSATPGSFDRAGPAFGQDVGYVLGQLCGYTDDEIDAMAEAGVTCRLAEPDTTLTRPYLAWAPGLLHNIEWPGSGRR
jgi:benzylsuccinate CoA-transferase BbsF subunit